MECSKEMCTYKHTSPEILFCTLCCVLCFVYFYSFIVFFFFFLHPLFFSTAASGKARPCKKKKRNMRRRRADAEMPPEIAAEPELAKYWAQRYRLFSRFDEGIKLDHGELSLALAFSLNLSCPRGISSQLPHTLPFFSFFQKIISSSPLKIWVNPKGFGWVLVEHSTWVYTVTLKPATLLFTLRGYTTSCSHLFCSYFGLYALASLMGGSHHSQCSKKNAMPALVALERKSF